MSELPGLDGLLGVQHVDVGADKVVAQFTIGEQHLQPFGIPHGGIYCTVHESTASVAAFQWITAQGEDKVVVGTNNVCDFLRRATVGDTITVTATPIHRGRSQQLWRVESTDERGRLVAQGQVRLANIDRRA